MAKKKAAKKKASQGGSARKTSKKNASSSKTQASTRKSSSVTAAPAKKKAKKKATAAASSTKKSAAKSRRKSSAGKTASKKKAATKKKATPRSTTTKRPRSLSADAVADELAGHWNDLLPDQQLATAILKANREQLMSNAEVTGFHVGLRRVGTKQQVAVPLEYVIRVHVANKRDPNHPMIGTLLPKTLGLPTGESVAVDVMERSYQSIPSEGAPEDRFLAPARGGIPIARKDLGTTHWGTLGIRMKLGNQLVAITNKHVIGVPEPGGATEVIQPATGRVDGDADPIIGHVLKSVHDDEIDCAVIVDDTARVIGSGVVDAAGKRISGTYVARRLTPADEKNAEVFKVGACTGDDPRRIAVVKNVCTSVRIDQFGWMHCQIVAESVDGSQIIDSGDSGSVLIARIEDDGMFTNCVVGLVHAEANDRTAVVACHIDRVQDRMGVRL
jgi:hypothetical protein